MSDRQKGALLGVSNVLVTAACYGIATASGFADSPSQIVRETRYDDVSWSAWYLVIFIAVPFGAGLGVLLGSLTESVGRFRTARYVGLALLCLSVVAPLWPPTMPYAIPVTILHAIALAQWTSRQSEPRAPSNLVVQKGAVLGVCAALMIAAGAAVSTLSSDSIQIYDLLSTPWFIDGRDPAATDLFVSTLMHAMPIAILWGALTGRVAHEMAHCWWLTRAFPVFATVVPVVTFTVFEPELLPIVGAVALFHTVVLLRWTAQPPSVPVASVSRYGQPRSIWSRDARSTTPTPKPSDTSRTIR